MGRDFGNAGLPLGARRGHLGPSVCLVPFCKASAPFDQWSPADPQDLTAFCILIRCYCSKKGLFGKHYYFSMLHPTLWCFPICRRSSIVTLFLGSTKAIFTGTTKQTYVLVFQLNLCPRVGQCNFLLKTTLGLSNRTPPPRFHTLRWMYVVQ